MKLRSHCFLLCAVVLILSTVVNFQCESAQVSQATQLHENREAVIDGVSCSWQGYYVAW